MPKWDEWALGLGNPLTKKGRNRWGDLFSGKLFSGDPEEQQYISRLSPEQQPLLNQAINAGMGPGAGGAYGSAADYYYNNLSNNPQDFQAYAAPEMRNFNENIIPNLGYQFAGMGSGNLDSSGYRNAAVNAGTDLQERLAKIRADLRSQSAQGLQNIGGVGLGNYGENIIRPQTGGLWDSLAPALGTLAGGALGSFAGPMGTAIGAQFGGALSGGLAQSNKGKSSPYGGTRSLTPGPKNTGI
jgi:hypothetical protein